LNFLLKKANTQLAGRCTGFNSNFKAGRTATHLKSIGIGRVKKDIDINSLR
jgi:hypothetical protein